VLYLKVNCIIFSTRTWHGKTKHFFLIRLRRCKQCNLTIQVADFTIVSYNAGVVKIYISVSVNKNIFFHICKKKLAYYTAGVVHCCKFKSLRIGSCCTCIYRYICTYIMHWLLSTFHARLRCSHVMQPISINMYVRIPRCVLRFHFLVIPILHTDSGCCFFR
jgi:hypothetical protein